MCSHALEVSSASRSVLLTCVGFIDVDLLLEKLGGLPLALVQAGAYLQQTNMSVERYVRHYDESWEALMVYEDRYPLQEYAERSVLTTWKLSYEQVHAVKPEATRLLDQWAFLHAGDVWYDLIGTSSQVSEHGENAAEDTVSTATSELSFQDSLGILAQYSLINASIGGASFSIHPVVHNWSLHNITDREVRGRLCAKAIRMVAKRVPRSGGPGSLIEARRILPHARTVASRQMRVIEVENLEHELNVIAYFMQHWESSQEVEGLYLRALKGKEEAWGPKHTSTLDTVNNLGALYSDQGKTKEAEEMYLRALRGKEEAWGPKHTSTLSTVNNLGNLYSDQGKMKEAEEMYLRALKGKEEAWGPKHTSTLDTVNNLGALYSNQGKMKEAEEMYLRALRGKEEAWGPKHTSTLSTVNNLGLLYKNQGKMKEAEEMYLRALRGYEEAWGPKHTSTLDTVNNLGALYSDQGKTKEAEEMYLRALRGKEEAWGPKHTSTLDTVYNLGNLYHRQAKLAEARRMYSRAAEGYENVEGGHEDKIRYLRKQLL